MAKDKEPKSQIIATPVPPVNTPVPETIQISKAEWEQTQKTLKMLTEVADKGRVLHYETANAEKKPHTAKLSVFADGLIIGWKVVRDELISNPTTGRKAGEVQEYEVKVLGRDNETRALILNGYPAFSEARYNERVDVTILSRQTDYTGKTLFEVSLPDGRVIKIDGAFLN